MAEKIPGDRKLMPETHVDAKKRLLTDPPTHRQSFHIIAIGASAGGLEAIEQLFKNMPPDTGMAFIIVQHLDPAKHSSMLEILSRYTKMQIYSATDGVKLEPDSIYLIPGSKSSEIHEGVLYLLEPLQAHGLGLPIDYLLRSLAKEKGQDAIGIILSGTGSDGTLGLQAIKDNQGTVIVQDPGSAKYGGMPSSAINSGLADYILKPEQIPDALISLSKHSIVEIDTSAKDRPVPLQEIFAILRTKTGHDFSKYKDSTVKRRLGRRMVANGIHNLSDYVQFLQENESETKALLKDLLISVTNFFRNPEAFEVLEVTMKEKLKNAAPGSDFRVWVAGCATGEEVYSIAIILAECIEELKMNFQVQIYGTDIDISALQIARTGRYPHPIENDITPKRLKRFFSKEDGTYKIIDNIREGIVFAPQDFIKDPPFSRMDLICCRNLLIYLDSDVQKRVLPLFHYALRPDGILFLGTSETVGESKDLFSVIDRKWKIYRRIEKRLTAGRLKFPAFYTPDSMHSLTHEEKRNDAKTKIPEIAEKAFHDFYSPTYVVIDENNKLIYVRGRTGKYFEIVDGQPDLSILDMARDGLRTDLGSAIFQVKSEKKPMVREAVRIKNYDGFQTVKLTVAPITEAGIPHDLIMVIFQDMEPVSEVDQTHEGTINHRRTAKLEDELRLTRKTLQSTIEEFEATNEQLKSTNEELQSNVEELQSTNEELDTSSEELQSVNEELTTVNAELQERNEMLSKANDDLNNFINRTEIAIILLDKRLRIRSFTPTTSSIFNIRSIDIGRPLNEISSRLVYDKMVNDAQEVLRTLQAKELEVRCKDGYWYSIRISAYRTAQNIVNGLVMSLLDINEQKKASNLLRETRDYLDSLMSYASAPVIVWNPKLEITRYNHAFEKLSGRTADEMLGKKIDILIPQGEREQILKEINRKATKDRPLKTFDIPIQHVDGSERMVIWNSATLFDIDGKTPIATIAQGQDITERNKKTVNSLKESEQRFRTLSETSPIGVGVVSTGGFLLYSNASFALTLKSLQSDLLGKQTSMLFGDAKDEKAFNDALQNSGGIHDMEIRLRRKDDTPVWTSINSSRIVYNDSQAMIVTIEDITKRKDAEDALMRYAAELEASNKELESFAYSLTHDLRSPLRSLDGFSQAVLDDFGDKLGDTGKDYLMRIRDAVQYMAKVTEDLLKISGVIRSELQFEALDLSKMVSAIIREFHEKNPDRNIQLVIAPNVVAQGDPTLLHLAIYNILDNAWKFTAQCSETKIEFGTINQEDATIYFIKDNGIGFDMKYYDKLFQPFHRLHSNKDIPGTGIGLATVQRVFRRHGGKVWAESEKDKGTTLFFTIGTPGKPL